MIKILKANNPINYLLMFGLMLSLWAFKFYYMPTEIEAYILKNYILPGFPETVFMKYLSAVLSFIVYYLFALLIIKFNANLMIVENAYQSAGVIFVMMTGFFINSQRILPETLASFTLFIAVMQIFNSYQKIKAELNILDASIFTALTVILVHKLVFVIALVFIVMVIIRPVKTKEVLIYFTGILFSFLVLVAIVWLTGDIAEAYDIGKQAVISKFAEFKYNSFNYIVFTPMIILAAISVFSRFSLSQSRKVSARKFQNAIVFIIVCLTVFFVSPHATNEGIVLIYPWVAILLSNVIINAKSVYASIVFVGFLVSLYAVHVLQIVFYLSIF